MSSDPAVASSGGANHGNLDEQISQLMQCKPLSEPEVLWIDIYLPPFSCFCRSDFRDYGFLKLFFWVIFRIFFFYILMYFSYDFFMYTICIFFFWVFVIKENFETFLFFLDSVICWFTLDFCESDLFTNSWFF